MEDDLIFLNERRPRYYEIGRRPYFYNFFLQKKDDLNILKNGRRPKKKYIYIYNQLHSTAHTSRQPDQQNKLK